MIDFHSHILPRMDDGSQSVAESISLLKMLAEQDVDVVAATPHFYANDESVSEFLGRRQTAYERLQNELFEGAPKILLGAEVRYYQGISRMTDLKRLCLEGSKLLLLEMPMSRWTEYTVRELVELSSSRDLTVVLAHVERYLHLQNRSVWDRLYESGILMQVNATFFTDFSTRRQAISLLKKRAIHFLGSDCHNLTHRPPYLGRAIDMIKKKTDDDAVNYIIGYAYARIMK